MFNEDDDQITFFGTKIKEKIDVLEALVVRGEVPPMNRAQILRLIEYAFRTESVQRMVDSLQFCFRKNTAPFSNKH